jgi:hypothetical protein
MTSHFYYTIRHRAIELLQDGFEDKSFEEIRTGERWYRQFAIGQALQTAVQEVQTREQEWLEENGKRTVLLRHEHSRLLTELKRVMTKKQPKTSKGDNHHDLQSQRVD